jgi:hypothetical protein
MERYCMDEGTALAEAVRLARACVKGRLSVLQTARDVVAYIDPWHPVWEALGGADGPLAALHMGQDVGDQCHFLEADVERWHPDVREVRREQLAKAEATAAPDILKACHALVEYPADTLGA